MTTDLENELREAMTARAGALPTGVGLRVRAVDYRPRRRRAPAAAGVLVGAAAAGTVVAVVVGGGAPAAYAGWNSTPAADPSASPAAAAACESHLGGGRSADGTPTSSPDPGQWQTLLTDVRGPFTVGLYQDGDAYAACFTSAAFTVVNQVESDQANGNTTGRVSVQQSGSTPAGGLQGVSVGSSSSGSLQSLAQSHLSTVADGPYTLADGRAQSGVTGVTLVLDNGQDVVASVADGWFIAWWPGSAGATSAQITRASGTTTEAIDPGPKSIPGGGDCTPQPASSGLGSVCHSGGSAPASPGNVARGTAGDSGTTGNTGKAGDTGDSGANGVVHQPG